jgi:hypothetical protein
VTSSKCIFPRLLVRVADVDTWILNDGDTLLSELVVELEVELPRRHLGMLFGVLVGETSVAKLPSKFALPCVVLRESDAAVFTSTIVARAALGRRVVRDLDGLEPDRPHRKVAQCSEQSMRLGEWDRRRLETVYGTAHDVGEVAMRSSKRREITVGRAIVARLDNEMFRNRE